MILNTRGEIAAGHQRYATPNGSLHHIDFMRAKGLLGTTKKARQQRIRNSGFLGATIQNVRPPPNIFLRGALLRSKIFVRKSMGALTTRLLVKRQKVRWLMRFLQPSKT